MGIEKLMNVAFSQRTTDKGEPCVEMMISFDGMQAIQHRVMSHKTGRDEAGELVKTAMTHEETLRRALESLPRIIDAHIQWESERTAA